MEFALLHSPFLSPSSSDPLAKALRDRGEIVRVISIKAALERNDADYGAVADAVAAQLNSPCALVVHSGAGGLVPSIVERSGAAVRRVIFVDAILPHDGKSWFETASEPLARRVRENAREGRARPWSDWFGDKVLAWLVPDEAERARLVADLPGIAIAFLEQAAPSIADGLGATRCAYLQLSAGYDAEAAGAATLGWETGRLDGDHLWWVTHPAEVAQAIAGIALPSG